MTITKEDIKEGIIQFFEETPNSSPSIILNNANEISNELMGIVAAQICIMRGEYSLIVTGENKDGVLLSLSQEVIDGRRS